jgi:hypothetical protein
MSGFSLVADSAWRAAASYAVLAVAATWPLVLHLGSALPIDLGDSLLHCWILSWGADHVLSLLHGHFDGFRGYWQAPIFHPAPFALAYSEHLFAQAVQIVPLYALTGNILLCYNALFLSTFVLSGLGTYLLVRELTSDTVAAWVAGLCYGFALYRLPHYTHIQVLSSQWLPFVFYGLRRFFVTVRIGPLAGATLALCVQNLSCGYYLIFFSPFVALYCLYEIADRRLWRSDQVWAGLVIMGLVTGLVTWPFLKPYLQLRALGFPPRTLQEVAGYSADVLGWVTSAPANRVWGRTQPFLRVEGEVFPGAVVSFLALAGIAARMRTIARRTAGLRASRKWQRAVPAVLLGAGALVVVLILLVGATGDQVWRMAGLTFRPHDLLRAWPLAVVLLATSLVLSPRARASVRGVPGSSLGFFVAAALAGVLLSMGPIVTWGGQPTELPAPYALLYWHVPGFDGLRVPARYSMLASFALAVVAGFGVRAIASHGARGRAMVIALTLAFLAESTGAPISVNGQSRTPGSPPDRMYVGHDVPAVYQVAATLPLGSSLIEFPFGRAAWDVQYVFYQRAHGLPIVNGYRGGFPRWHDRDVAAFANVVDLPELAWDVLRRTGASHAILHRGAYPDAGADIMERWLLARGAREVSVAGPDRLYALPSP